MKKILFAFVLILSAFNLRADEGMWLPMLLEGMTITDMQARGCKLSAEDIYSINTTSMKDGICQFGGGCTAEMISDKGLLLTNHHCGFGYIQMHSSVEHDYLTNGFWAMNASEELPCPGLTAMFIVSMEDVTNLVLSDVKGNMTESERNASIQKRMGELEKERTKGDVVAMVRSFYYGNAFYLFMTETYNDVRMVGAPPMAMGNFGGDTDNWVWPRHTADFSMFRIYADKNNRPATYSKDNVPYKPKKAFTINASGVKIGDFTMVYGFPGRTTEYLSSWGVDLIANVSDPVKVKLRTLRLDIMREEMMKSDVVRIQYAAKRNGAANAWKKWQGEMEGLQQTNAVGKKQKREAEFSTRIAADATFTTNYGSVLGEMKQRHEEIKPWQLAVDYMNEGILSIELIRYVNGYRKLVEACKAEKRDQSEIDKQLKGMNDGVDGWFKDYNSTVDQRIAVAVSTEMQTSMEESKKPAVFAEVKNKQKGNWKKYYSKLFGTTAFSSREKVKTLLNGFTADKWQTIANDPAYILMDQLYSHFSKQLLPEFQKYNNEINRLNRIYMEAQMKVFPEFRFYPDANSTLRVTYGNILPYNNPAAVDGNMYNWYTTLNGVAAKNNPSIPDYIAPKRLMDFWRAKDYGRYADKNDGELHTCFIATNHTTGGNSGSPVFNAYGELIGTNFDRVWEGTMSDVSYDVNRCRNITLDVRYTLWVIDKYAGAGYLLDEMKIKW
jgi:hypothetical protein